MRKDGLPGCSVLFLYYSEVLSSDGPNQTKPGNGANLIIFFHALHRVNSIPSLLVLLVAVYLPPAIIKTLGLPLFPQVLLSF